MRLSQEWQQWSAIDNIRDINKTGLWGGVITFIGEINRVRGN